MEYENADNVFAVEAQRANDMLRLRFIAPQDLKDLDIMREKT